MALKMVEEFCLFEVRMHQVPNEMMKHMSIPHLPPPSPLSTNPLAQDLLWISKQQQQHPSTHAHPLKNTIRVNSRGVRYKFDGKQWRPLCMSPDGHECRNLAFRSSLCQKHFYKIHLFKRPYGKNSLMLSRSSSGVPPVTLKCQIPSELTQRHHDRCQNEEQSKQQQKTDSNHEMEQTDEADDSIEVIEDNDAVVSKTDRNESQPVFSYFSIDCDSEELTEKTITNEIKSELSNVTSSSLYASRTEGITKRLDSTNTESVISNESDASSSSPSLGISMPKMADSMRFGIPPLTRTEEKSLANELITQLPNDASLTMGEQMARRRACEIVFDNYSHRLSSDSISTEWFYDFLLRNPRVPIHFQIWFSRAKSTLPSSDQLIEIKIWELGLVTRSIIPSSSMSTSSCSP